MSSEFVHLHVHSHYSLLDGGNRMAPLLAAAKAHGMKAIACTDHGNLYGAIEFYNKAQEVGLKPILGMEAYIAPRSRKDRGADTDLEKNNFHLLLLAINSTGWRNLMRLSSRSYLEGFYYRPRVDRELLAEFGEGLVCTSACLGGEIPQALLNGQEERARKIAGEYRDIFGPERFFIEVQNQGEPDQNRVNPLLIRLAKDIGVGIVGTNDVHFLRREDKRAHEVLTCISTGNTLDSPMKMKYSNELYLKSPDEMSRTLEAWPEAVENTLKIAEMCNVKLEFGKKHLPFFRTPDGTTPDDFLRMRAWAGLKRKFPDCEPPVSYATRLERELDVIKGKGYSSYFLIIDDFVNYAKTKNIPASPRGSGVATLLGYVLGVSAVDPVKYNLLFERFTDPQRKEDPDVDIDICQEGREEVIQYVRERYGHVAQIVTYGTLKARNALRDVGRVLGAPIPEVNRLVALLPPDPKITLDRALEESPEFQAEYKSNGMFHEMVDFGRVLEGHARNAGVHAAGVVVCDEPLEGLVPLMCMAKEKDKDITITQWDGPTCEKVGMMKMDILGLKTLTVIQRAREMVKARTGRDFDPAQLPLEDDGVLELFRQGDTDAVFQFESEGMKKNLREMQPTRLEDLIAANAMYRPGPMELIPQYCRRKKGEEKVEPIHPLVDELLAETYGIMVYQEQVMQVLNRLGGLSLSDSLTLIKAISKKKEKDINAARPKFMAGAKDNGIAAAEATRLFDLILKFAGYGFNKAHSTGYAIIAYQTAWFKKHYPAEFWAASLTYESNDQDKLKQYMDSARHAGMTIGPPDVNTSEVRFTVDGQAIRFGLKAVKGVGEAAVTAIMDARESGGPFKNLFDFCTRVDLHAVNKGALEALIKCGALDRCGGAHRAALAAALEPAMAAGTQEAQDRASGQMNLFGAGSVAPMEPVFPRVLPWTTQELLAAEKETLGYYVSAHPMDEFRLELAALNVPRRITLGTLGNVKGETPVAVGGIITAVKKMVVKNGKSAGKTMARITLEDYTGRCEATVFPGDYDRLSSLLLEGGKVQVRGTAESSDRRAMGNGGEGERASAAPKAGILVRDLVPMKNLVEKMAASMDLRLSETDLLPGRVAGLQKLLAAHPGTLPITLRCVFSSGSYRCATIEVRGMRVNPGPELIRALEEYLGAGSVSYHPQPFRLPERKRPEWESRRRDG